MKDFVHVVCVDDYGDFKYMAETFKGVKAKGFEYGFGDNNMYWGIIYAGKRPKQSEIRKMLDDNGYTPQSNDF